MADWDLRVLYLWYIASTICFKFLISRRELLGEDRSKDKVITALPLVIITKLFGRYHQMSPMQTLTNQISSFSDGLEGRRQRTLTLSYSYRCSFRATPVFDPLKSRLISR